MAATPVPEMIDSGSRETYHTGIEDGKKHGGGEPFFIEDPCILLSHIRLLPTAGMTLNEKLNALARIVIVIAIGLYVMKYDNWLVFLIAAMLGIVMLKVYFSRGDKEGFTLVPTYANPDMQTTTVAPLFAEEWSIIPPAYDLYVNTPPKVGYEEPEPRLYPYGQFLSPTNLLPSDEQAIRMLNGGDKQAREYVNGAFIRHTLAARDNFTRIYKKRLARRFRHNNTYDTFSPFHSY